MCACACVRVLVCVSVCLRLSFGMRKIYARLSMRTLSLAHYILYGVKLQPNTHQNETTDSETSRIKEMEGKSSFKNSVASPHRELV